MEDSARHNETNQMRVAATSSEDASVPPAKQAMLANDHLNHPTRAVGHLAAICATRARQHSAEGDAQLDATPALGKRAAADREGMEVPFQQAIQKAQRMSKLSEKAQWARAKAAEERTAQAVTFAWDWVVIVEEELSGVLSSEHAKELRKAWQKRLAELSDFQIRRVHKRISMLYTEWAKDTSLVRRLDKPWLDALETMASVRSTLAVARLTCAPQYGAHATPMNGFAWYNYGA